MKIIRTLADGKNFDTAWLTSAIKSAKANIMTKTSKNAVINNLPFLNPYEVLCINENDYVQNANEDTSERAIKSKRNNVVTRTTKQSGSAGCAAHSFA